MTSAELEDFKQLWGRVSRGAFQKGDSLEGLVRAFAGALRFEVKAAEGDECCAFFVVKVGDDIPLYPGGRAVLLALNDKNEDHTEELYERLARSVYDYGVGTCPAVVLEVSSNMALKALLRSSPIPFVLLDIGKVAMILRGSHEIGQFVSRVQLSAGTDLQNPFQYAGPLRSPDMFYGRTSEIKYIGHMTGKNFVILGPRKSGKTSLLYRIEADIKKEGNIEVGYFDLSLTQTSDQAAHEIATWLQPKSTIRFSMEQFPYLLKRMSSRQRVLLLDECDAVVAHDVKTGDRLSKSLDAARKFRFVMAGYTILSRRLQNWNSKLWNVAEKVLLGKLDVISAHNLIQDPLVQRGFSTPSGTEWRAWAEIQTHQEYAKSPNWIAYILQNTDQYPALLQLYGHQLFKLVVQQGRYSITPQDVADAEMVAVYEMYVLPFVNNTAAVTRLIGTLVVAAGGWPQSEEQIFQATTQQVPCVSALHVREALDELVNVGILNLDEEGYRLAFPAFQMVLKHKYSVHLLRSHAMKQLLAGGL